MAKREEILLGESLIRPCKKKASHAVRGNCTGFCFLGGKNYIY